jgi:hypothetical protein
MGRAILVSLFAMLLTGCYLGPGLKDTPFARGPQGVEVDASGRQGSFAGELLAVQDAGLLLLVAPPGGTGERVMLLPYDAIQKARFGKLGARYELKDGQPPAATTRECLQRVSRFPQGLSESLLGRLLEAYGQAEVEKVPN